MIRWMASAVKADHIVHSVVALGNILRPVFASKDTMCSLRDEINYLENYIKIINYRFNNTITFTFDIEPSYLDYRIPRFILQPLIENSTKSGRPDDNVIDIAIEVYEQDNDLWISVIDSGRGFDPQMREQLNNQLQSGDSYTSEQQEYSSGVGLYNVNKRIQLYFGKAYGIQLPQVPYGAEVAIHLPRLLESKDHIL